MNKIKIYISLIVAFALVLFTPSCSQGQEKERDSGKNIPHSQEKNSDVPTWTASFKNESLPTEEDISQMIGQLEHMFQELEEAESDLQKGLFDLQAILDQRGSDPTQLYEWVRDETFMVPYRGSLRGPRGVLMDRLALPISILLKLRQPGICQTHGQVFQE